MAVEGPLSTTDTYLVKANIAIINEQISIIESQTRNEIQAMREDVEEKKRALEQQLILEQDRTNVVDAILLLYKDAVNDLHISSRALKKQMKSLEGEISNQISTLSLLSKEAMDLQAQQTVQWNAIHREEQEMVSHTIELEKCKQEHQRMLQLSGEQHKHNSIVIGGFDNYAQETQIPLFLKWEKPAPPRRVRDETLAASYILPKSSIFFDVLQDPEHRLTFFSK
jgi:wobble nucleotide-excising tRNase